MLPFLDHSCYLEWFTRTHTYTCTQVRQQDKFSQRYQVLECYAIMAGKHQEEVSLSD